VRETVPLIAVGVTNYNPDMDASGAWAAEIAKVVSALMPGQLQ
jgi:hypothetical protein